MHSALESSAKICYFGKMENSSRSSSLAGRAGMLLVVVGVVLFMAGIFGAPRVLAFTGVAMMAVSLVAFFIEEHGQRKQTYY